MKESKETFDFSLSMRRTKIGMGNCLSRPVKELEDQYNRTISGICFHVYYTNIL
jgi:hypothetical protein